MIYYKFRTLVTSYFFPQIDKNASFIYFLYGNYGNIIAKLYWWLFTHSSFIRTLTKVDSSDIEDFEILNKLIGTNSIFAINYGTPNNEQKKSILGLETKTGRKFFAKYAVKENAKRLSKNEIMIYNLLTGTNLVPEIYESIETHDYVFFKCECIEGKHVTKKIDPNTILKILFKLKTYHYPNPDRYGKTTYLKTSLAHCDFCQWNMIDVNGNIHIIDWELAQERPLGFDLFTYIFNNNWAQDHKITDPIILHKYKKIIKQYFDSENIKNWVPYLNAFIEIKMEWQKDNPDKFYYNHLITLNNLIKEKYKNELFQ